MTRTIPSKTVEYWKTNKLDIEAMIEVRHRCQTDLFYLMKTLGYPDFQEGGDVDQGEKSVHREMCAFMVKKNPDSPFREFCKQDQDTHERLGMVSRGGLKSTIFTIGDSVQWIICYPDITILLITGTQTLGQELLSETKGHFERQESTKGEDGNKLPGLPKIVNGKASVFQLAFPEFCTDGEVNKSFFVTPARENPDFPREATMSFGTVEANLSGPHYDIVKADDCVTNENSRVKTRLADIRKQMSMHHKVRQPWGYFDNIGTWYDISDYYGNMVRSEEKNKTMFWVNGKGDSRDTGSAFCLTKIYIRPCMWRKDGEEPLIDGELRQDDWELWWDKRLNWRYLMGEHRNLDTFATQYMQNPVLGRQVRFTRDRITNAIKVFSQLPDIHSGVGVVVQYWDTAYKADNPRNNYTVGITALILGGRFFILGIKRGQFNEIDLPNVIADEVFKWRPRRVTIEDANGVRWLVQHGIYPAFKSRGIQNIWVEYLAVDNTKNSKETNIKPFAKALIEGRVIFSNAIPDMDYVITEFEAFPNGEFDDVVDACGALVRTYGELPEAMVKMTDDEIKHLKDRHMDRMAYNQIFGTGRVQTNQLNTQTVREDIPKYVQYNPLDEFER